MWQQVLNSLQSSECHSVHLTVSSLIQAGLDQSHLSVCIRRYRCPFFIPGGSAVRSFLNFGTRPMRADHLCVGELENLCSRNQSSTLQRSIVPSLDSFGKLNFDFLALLNLLQLSGWICCVCILLPDLFWHNSFSLHIYPLLFPHPCLYSHQQVDKSSKPKKHVQCSRKQSIHIKKEKQKKKSTMTHSFINALRLKLRFHEVNGPNQATNTFENAYMS